MSRLTIFATALVVALAAFPIQAQQPPTAQVYCNLMANYAEAVAKDRDNGVPQIRALLFAAREPHPKLRSDYITLVHIVHSQPHQEPIKEAGTAFELCWAAHGGK